MLVHGIGRWCSQCQQCNLSLEELDRWDRRNLVVLPVSPAPRTASRMVTKLYGSAAGAPRSCPARAGRLRAPHIDGINRCRNDGTSISPAAGWRRKPDRDYSA